MFYLIILELHSVILKNWETPLKWPYIQLKILLGLGRISGGRILSGRILTFAGYPDIRYPVIFLPDIRPDIRYPANPPDIRYPAILPDYPAGYLIIFNKKIKFTISINFCFVPSYFIMLCLSYFLLIRIFCDWLKLIQESRLPTSLCISITIKQIIIAQYTQ